MSPAPLRRTALLGLLTLLSAASPSVAADQALRGTRLVVKNPDVGDPAQRSLSFSARDGDGTHTLSGDPTAPPSSGGAVLSISLEGTTPSSQSFVLPQGTTSRGKPLWRALGAEGFRYDDPKGERGPVKSLRVRRARSGSFSLSAKLHAKGGSLELVPPDAGSGAFASLVLGGGDRYCVRFTGGRLRDRGARSFEVRRPEGEGCPALAEGELLALSYNVAGLPESLSGSDPEINTPLIAPLLNEYELVLLQESWKTPDPNPTTVRVYHEILEAGSLHPFRSVSAPLPLGADPFRPSALVSDGLNRFSNFPFEELVRVPWAECWSSAADCFSLKGFSVARTSFAPGATVDVYNLHMEAGGDEQDELLRDQGVTQLVAFMADFSAGRPVIVGGDFNLHTDEEPDASQYQRLLDEAGLSDVCAALACPEPERIDKFAFRSAGAVTLEPLTWRFETDVFVRDGDVPLSDHEALAVRFAWSVTGE